MKRNGWPPWDGLIRLRQAPSHLSLGSLRTTGQDLAPRHSAVAESVAVASSGLIPLPLSIRFRGTESGYLVVTASIAKPALVRQGHSHSTAGLRADTCYNGKWHRAEWPAP